MGRGGPVDSHSIISEWGGAWVVPAQVRVVWAIPKATYMSPKLFLLLACLSMIDRQTIVVYLEEIFLKMNEQSVT
jgi:hypothetical protein